MNTYTLTVYIDAKIVVSKPEDCLLLLRKVNGEYCSPFCTSSIRPEADQRPLLQVNKFQWKDDFAVFLIFKNGSPDKEFSSSNEVPITLGEKVTCDNNVLSEPEPAEQSLFSDPTAQKSCVLLCNVPDYFRSCLSMCISDAYKPIYVDGSRHTGVSNNEIKPENEYIICWADKRYKSLATVLKSPRSRDFEFVPGTNEINLRWGYKTLNKPETVYEQPSWYTWVPSKL